LPIDVELTGSFEQFRRADLFIAGQEPGREHTSSIAQRDDFSL